MADELTEETFCAHSAVRGLHTYKKFRDCLVLLNQANLSASHLSMYGISGWLGLC